MYVIRSHLMPTTGRAYSSMLTEMSKAEFAMAEQSDRCLHYRIAAHEAHRWVCDGGLHDTPLYVDQGRIRRARDAS